MQLNTAGASRELYLSIAKKAIRDVEEKRGPDSDRRKMDRMKRLLDIQPDQVKETY